MWRTEEFVKQNAEIFGEEMEGFLPRKILDFHVHVFPAATLTDGLPFICAGHPIEKYDIEDFETDMAAVLPGRNVSAVIFGLPDPKYDNDINNRYVAECGNGDRYTPFRMFDPHVDTPDTLSADIDRGVFRGLKPYLTFARKKNPDDVQIPDMLPDWVMEIANSRKLIITLHIPRKLRLADPDNQKYVAEYAEKYPDATLVIAHIGRAYFLKNIAGNLERLKDLPNVYIDLAMLNNWEVLEHAFRQFDHKRILFGSDVPVALAPGKSVEIDNQYTYVTPVPWELSISDEHAKLKFTSFLYEEFRAIRKAVERLGLGKDFVRDILYRNGTCLLNKNR